MAPGWNLAAERSGSCDEVNSGRAPRPARDGGELTMASASSPEGHVQPLLGAYVLGGLTASQEAAVRAHLERCARCQAEHDWLAVVPSWLDLLAAEDEAGGADSIQDPPPPGLPWEGL
jgi:hypothetical protein